MIIVGLTGSVASGKSTVAGWMRKVASPFMMLMQRCIACWRQADRRWQKSLLNLAQISKHLMVALTVKNLADMCLLIQLVVKNSNQYYIRWFGNIVINSCKINSVLAVTLSVLDVPLLYETGGDGLCDYVIVVYAGEETIRHRALSRPGMTEEKLSGILATQMPASEKCQRADFVLDTDFEPDTTRQHLFTWLDQITDTLDISKGKNECVKLLLIRKQLV